MKKLNKKGFTLIELLAVLVILVVIMAIAIPSVTSSIERSKQKEYDAKVKLIVSAAELCQDAYKNKFVSGYDRLNLERVLKTINYGTLSIKACPIVSNVFAYFAEDIVSYARQYYQV